MNWALVLDFGKHSLSSKLSLSLVLALGKHSLSSKLSLSLVLALGKHSLSRKLSLSLGYKNQVQNGKFWGKPSHPKITPLEHKHYSVN